MTVWQVCVIAAWAGHFGLMLAAYNRINGVGIKRSTTKKIVKVMFFYTITFPVVIAWWYMDAWSLLLIGGADIVPDGAGIPGSQLLPTWLLLYGAVCLSAWLLLGIPWLLFRPIIGLEWVNVQRHTEVVNVAAKISHDLPLSTRCRWESKLPLNQIFDLSIEEVQLPVPGLPAQLDGYRIAHLSDLHLTGHVHQAYSQYVIERANAWGPDLIVASGDIIDSPQCIDWLECILGPATAPDGCFFVLGNHDTRISDPSVIREEMERIGWTDLGGKSRRVQLRGAETLLMGNEWPWFERPHVDPIGPETFRLLLSHSPDQITWARHHHVHLVLAGHTHGGQGRLPLIGPLLSPSLHGSRFAAGDFYKAPTTMHVSRGLCGTHLIRINCRPELSLLVLRTN